MAEVLASEELIEEPSDFGALQPGMRLGRYELLVPIARGGMARVWAARLHGQRGFQKLVAIKVILPHLAQEPEFERMFLDEARIASGVHHPNVCEIYELGEEQRTLYLVMEWVNGDSFSRVLRASGRTEAVDPRVVARIVADACAGVHAAHELTDDEGRPMGVVHRDLSPHNILLTADGTAKVCDFGVAKALNQLHEATSAGQLKGKIAYMAPEQITGSEVDRRSDVFSLGCVLYEATTGVRPFRGEGDHQVMHAVLKGEITPPSSYVRGYPSELERIVLRALAPKPLLRFPTAERMRFALEELLARGTLVTQANVAQMVRSRIGEPIDKRRERIRQASLAGDRAGDPGSDRAAGFRDLGGMTPSNQPSHGSHARSGVQPSGGHPVSFAPPAIAGPSGPPGPAGPKPLFSTVQMDRPEAVAQLGHVGQVGPPMPGGPPTSPSGPPMGPTYPGASPSGGYPQVVVDPRLAPQAGSHASYPGASYPGASYPGASYPGAAYPAAHPGASYPGALYTPSGAQPMHAPPTYAPPPHAGSYVGMPPQDPSLAPSSLAPPPGYASGQVPSPFGPGPNGPAGPVPSEAQPPPGAHYAIAIVVGLLIAGLIGVGGFVVWRKSHGPAVAEPLATQAPASATPAGVPVAPLGSAPAVDGTVKAPSAEVSFQVSPAEATITVDGQELGAQVHAVPRPAMGKSVNVVVKAKGFEDQTVAIDYFTASPATVALKPASDVPPAVVIPEPPSAAASAPTTAAPAATSTGEPPAREPKKKKDPKPDPAVPANPY